MTKAELMQAFMKRDTASVENLKQHVGERLKPCGSFFSPSDGSERSRDQIVIDFTNGKTYRTGCTAFIKRWDDFMKTFGAELEPADWPEIEIISKRSKSGNDYIDFTVIL